MKRYSVFHAPFLSFFSQDFYRDVDRHWKGTGFAYLLLLLTICWVPIFIQFHASVSAFVTREAPAFTSQIPTIRIMKGEVSVDAAQPYKIKDPESGAVLAVIDTTGKTTSLEGTEAVVLLTKTEMIYKKSNVETRSFSLNEIDNFVLDRTRVAGWLEIFRRAVAVILFPFAVLGSFAFRILQVLLYAAIGTLFARQLKMNRPYETLLRLAVMAVTPVIIAGTIVDVAGIKIPFQGLFFFVAALGYLYFALHAVSRQDVVREDQSPSVTS